MFFNGSLINNNQTITLTRSNTNQTYQFICSSIGSRPDVSLSLYDTNSSLKLSNNLNSIEQSSCNINNICTAILQVNFQFTDASFDTMTSLSCGTSSKTPSVPLATSISRNTIVIDYLTTTSKILLERYIIYTVILPILALNRKLRLSVVTVRNRTASVP
jgi:hypothetical protein